MTVKCGWRGGRGVVVHCRPLCGSVTHDTAGSDTQLKQVCRHRIHFLSMAV